MFDPFVNENSNPYFHLMNIEALLIDLISKHFMSHNY